LAGVEQAVDASLDRRTNNFDALRLLAAWLVLFSHSYPISGQRESDPFARYIGIDTLGGVGVAIFFVLSGYLVTNSLATSRSVLSFAKKRALRIFPALVVITVLCAYGLGPILTTVPLATYFDHPQTHAFLWNMSAYFIFYGLPGVFIGNPEAGAVNGSLWSLPYEISCYFALILLWLLRVPRRISVTLIVAVLVIFLCLRPPMPPGNGFDTFWGVDYFTVKLGLMFSIGVWFQLWKTSVQPGFSVSCLLMVFALAMNRSHLQTAVFVIGFSIFVLALGLRRGAMPRLPSKMGDWSYGLYLYAFPVQQVLAMYGLASFGVVAFTAASTVVAFAFAALSWYLIEKPAMAIAHPNGGEVRVEAKTII
jgi:peptidoglycan/LPS O-acetylase OafA/YrhL